LKIELSAYFSQGGKTKPALAKNSTNNASLHNCVGFSKRNLSLILSSCWLALFELMKKTTEELPKS
jgi:hypothetical protein